MKLGKNRSPWSPMIRDDALLVVFKGPVAWTGKRPETGPKRTDLDRTAVVVAPPFRMDEPPATGPVKTGCNRLEILLQNTFKTHLKTLKMIKI